MQTTNEKIWQVTSEKWIDESLFIHLKVNKIKYLYIKKIKYWNKI